MSGSTGSPNLPVTQGAVQPSYRGEGDAFIARLAPDGYRFLYFSYLGGSGMDWITSAAVDRSGNLFVAGNTTSTDFPVTQGAYQLHPAGVPRVSYAMWVAKVNTAGSALLWSTYLGGSGYDGSPALALDSEGAVYIAGSTTSTDFPVTAGAFQTEDFSPSGTLVRSPAAYIAKLDASGSRLVFSTYVGPTFGGSAVALAVDSQGNSYITGTTDATTFPVQSPLQPILTKNLCLGTNGGAAFQCSDAFVFELDRTGSKDLFSTYLGGLDNDSGNAVAVDAVGRIVVVGYANSPGLPFHRLPESKGGSVFVMRLDPSGITPGLSPTGIVSAASFTSVSLAPGSIASVFGVNLSPDAESHLAGGTPLPVSLSGVQVEVNGAAVPLFGIFNFGSYQQINFQLPFDLANGFATLDVVNNGVKSLVFSFPVFRIPEVFTVGETGMAAAQHADGSPVSPASPARGGETIMVYATGLGATDPPIQAGIVTPSTPLFHTVGQVSAILGGISAPVTFSGLTPGSVGLFQINLQVPLGVSGNANLIVSFPEGNRSKAVQIPVQ